MSVKLQPVLVSICSDFGNTDFRTAALKARILANCPSASLVDVTHEIRPFDLVQAAFVGRNAFIFFPEGSIHVIWVFNAGVDRGILLALYRNHYFIIPDNGLISLITGDEKPEKVYRISDDSYEFRDRIGAAIRNILSEEDPLGVFEECENPVKRINVSPVYQKERIQARVSYVDRYGNLVLNLQKEPFAKVAGDRTFSFQTASHQEISNFYLGETNAENGSFYCYFNHAGFMTLALCGASAAATLDLKNEDFLLILFK